MPGILDPYHRWLGIPPKDQPPNHYRLLGIERFESDQEVIRDGAEQRMAHVRTYQLGQYSELSQKILNELAAAKACLLDPQKKTAYDRQLRAFRDSPEALGSVADSLRVCHPTPLVLKIPTSHAAHRWLVPSLVGGIAVLVAGVGVALVLTRDPGPTKLARRQMLEKPSNHRMLKIPCPRKTNRRTRNCGPARRARPPRLSRAPSKWNQSRQSNPNRSRAKAPQRFKLSLRQRMHPRH